MEINIQQVIYKHSNSPNLIRIPIRTLPNLYRIIILIISIRQIHTEAFLFLHFRSADICREIGRHIPLSFNEILLSSV
jgi:hypothetical protein